MAISGDPNVEGVTIDTAAQDQKVIDRWANGKKDVSESIQSYRDSQSLFRGPRGPLD